MQITKSEYPASIGAMLLAAGKISAEDVERIIAFQKQKGISFGQAAKTLGLITDDDIQSILSQQFDFPILTSSQDRFSTDLVAAYQPYNEQVEALRIVREQLMLRWFIEGHKYLAVVSPSRGEGRSYVAANLAIVFSQLGERTLLIDADLRQPRQHDLFKFQNSYGLSDLLAGRTDLSVITKIPVFHGLSVLPAGTIPPNPVELIRKGLKNCLQQLQTMFDVILIDTPSAEQGMDAQIIALSCGAALIVARQDKTRFQDLKSLREALYTSGSQYHCAVLTNF
jgi:protein-tyrosine kinase